MKKIYFDNAATTPLAPEVLEAMLPYLKEDFGNPSSIHSFGTKPKVAIEKARKTIAELLNVTPSEIFFTSGGTEADNTAIIQSVLSLNIKRIITSPIEHHAVEQTIIELEKRGWVKAQWLQVNNKGQISLEELETLLKQSNEPTLVCLMHANNEIGTLLPLKRVAELCKAHNAYFQSDTVQTVGHYQIDLQAAPVDFIAASAHKFHGPKGTGFLFVRNNIKISPLIMGGSQERNMRGGTENVAGIIGLAKAIELAHINMSHDQEYISTLKQYTVELLKKHIPNVSFNGESEEKGLYTILNFSLPQHPASEMMLYKLDMAGIAVSSGSACNSGSNQISYVLKHIGTDTTKPAIRFSFSKYNTKQEVEHAVKILADIYTE